MSLESSVPVHLGIILDGNRRWAKSKGLPTLEGHRQGAENFKTVSLAAFDHGIKYVSAYVFSNENWARTQEEISYLMKLVLNAVEKYLDEFQQKGIRIVILGSREKLGKKVVEAIDRTIERTKANSKGTLALCFNYGGQAEIVDAVKDIIDQKIPAKEVSEKTIEQNLYSSDIPPLDLLIRTSGEQRTSGFMLWRAAYAELLFSKTLWPDFSIEELDTILTDYKYRDRRFGK